MLLLGGCPRKPAPPPEPAQPPLAETPLPPSETADFQIGPITQTNSEDGHEVYVEGTVRNTGSRVSRDVKVWVDALDASGARLARNEVLPTPQAIAPGAAARFLVRLPNDPAIKSFHVEAVGR